MRICIVGESESAKRLRGSLGTTFAVVRDPDSADYVLRLEIDPTAEAILFDSVDGSLDENIRRHVRQLTPLRISTDTAEGVQSDRDCRIVCPEDQQAQDAIVKGAYRGFLDLLKPADNRPIKLDEAVVKSGAPLNVEQAVFLLEQATSKLANLLVGAAKSSYREQALRDYAALSAQVRAENAAALAEIRAVILLQNSEELHRIREDLRPKPIEGNRNAGFFARLWAAIKGNIAVLESKK